MKFFTHISGQKAFTLVEALVAVSILSMAVTGPLLIAQKGIKSSIYARDQITAFYLAQEAVEYVRNVRDTNRMKGEWWLKQFCSSDGCTTVNDTYKIDATVLNFNNDDGSVNTSAIASCAGSCPVLNFDTSRKLYGYGSGGFWEPTAFTRTVSINNTESENEALVSVNIAWNTNLFTPQQSFTVREYIFNF